MQYVDKSFVGTGDGFVFEDAMELAFVGAVFLGIGRDRPP
jgi:hypothetical protein